MKIGVISDLHIDRYNSETLKQKDFSLTLANEVSRAALDMLLIAGDISNDHVRSYRFYAGTRADDRCDDLFRARQSRFLELQRGSKSTREI